MFLARSSLRRQALPRLLSVRCWKAGNELAGLGRRRATTFSFCFVYALCRHRTYDRTKTHAMRDDQPSTPRPTLARTHPAHTHTILVSTHTHTTPPTPTFPLQAPTSPLHPVSPPTSRWFLLLEACVGTHTHAHDMTHNMHMHMHMCTHTHVTHTRQPRSARRVGVAWAAEAAAAPFALARAY